MQRLIEGLRNFMDNVYPQERELFETLANQQHPEVLFVTCSDSRISPNLVTQTRPGDIFTLRNAGNIVPPYRPDASGGEEATVEYAVSALGVKDIVVCGHSNCGAMRGLLAPAELAKLPTVAQWLRWAEPTRRIIEESFGDLDPNERLLTAARVNVLVQLSNLTTHPAVADRMKAGDLRLHGWVYDIAKGQVFAYDCERGDFFSIVDHATPLTQTDFQVENFVKVTGTELTE